MKAAAPHVATNGATVDLGRVGEPVGKEKPALLIDLCRKGYVPVVSSIGASRDGELFNVNADTLAAHLAGRLKSPRLIIAGATAGVLERDGSTIADMTFRDVDALIGSGGATAGMVAKLGACRSALESGAREVFVADGKDLAGLAVLASHGRAAGAGKSTRITKGDLGVEPKSEEKGIMSSRFAISSRNTSSRPTAAHPSCWCAEKACACSTKRDASISTC